MERYQSIRLQLEQAGQLQLLAHWEALTADQQNELLNQIEAIDLELMQQLYDGRQNGGKKLNPDTITPLAYTRLDSQTHDDFTIWCERGYNALRSGKVGALLVAGGQGTRLGHNAPKGTVEIGLPSGHSLFELQALRLRHLQEVHRAKISWAIMTSKLNDRDTKRYFEENGYFGLNREDLFFFSQGELPALDNTGKILLAAPGEVAFVPDGNGGVFAALEKSGGLQWLASRGCETVFLYGVDNAMVRVCDPTMIGFHLANGRPVSCPVVRKAYPEERVGIFVECDGNSCVAEYTDITDEMRFARDPKGNLIFDGSNLAIHLLQIEVLREAASQKLPYHAAYKAVPYCDEKGEQQNPQEPNSWKFEQFMFDVFPRYGAMAAIEVERSEHFGPVKNSWGEDSPESARKLILNLHTRWLKMAGLIDQNDQLLYEVSPMVSLSGGHIYNRHYDQLLREKLLFIAKER